MSEDNNNSATNGPTLSDAQQYLDFWKEFDLDGRRLLLDKTCVEMKEMKTNAITSRKKLNDLTKSFRGKSKDEQYNMMNDILKEYQEEIDRLTRRSKYGETAFYNLYKALYEAPCPAYAIEQLMSTVTSSSTHSLEIERLKSELNQYDVEFQQLKNQDITIRRLEEQLQEYRDNIELKVNEQVQSKIMEIEEKSDSKIAEIRDEQRSSERRLALAIDSMKQAQALCDRAQSQVFEISSQAESRISGLQAENTILAEGSQRANNRILELERELEQLKSVMSSQSVQSNQILSQSSSGINLNSSSGDGTIIGNKDLQQILINDLRLEMQRMEDLLRSDRTKYENATRDLTFQLKQELEISLALKQELSERPSKEDLTALRRQLKLLQKTVFNIQDDDDDEVLDDSAPEHTQHNQQFNEKVQFEMLLTARLKTVENELAETKRHLQDSREQEKLARSAAASLKVSLDASAALVQRLEADLEMRTSKLTSNEIRKRALLDHNSSNSELNDASQGLAELLLDDSDNSTLSQSTNSKSFPKETVKSSDATISSNVTLSSASVSAINSSNSQQQLITILQGQRDRYKDRLTQVEQHLNLVQQQLDTANNTKAQLETDNLALYSKIRFLQTYSGHPGSNSSAPNMKNIKSMKLRGNTMIPHSQHGNDEELGFDQSDMENKYQYLYEQRISPFAEFSQFERQRKLNELTVADRIVLNTTMAFVSSHTGRSFLLIYLGAMHLLVFVTLYYSAHHVHYGCDPSIDSLLLQHQNQLISDTAKQSAVSLVNSVAKHFRF